MRAGVREARRRLPLLAPGGQSEDGIVAARSRGLKSGSRQRKQKLAFNAEDGDFSSPTVRE